MRRYLSIGVAILGVLPVLNCAWAVAAGIGNPGSRFGGGSAFSQSPGNPNFGATALPPISTPTNANTAPAIQSAPSEFVPPASGTLPTYTFGAGGPEGVNSRTPGAGNVNVVNQRPSYISGVPPEQASPPAKSEPAKPAPAKPAPAKPAPTKSPQPAAKSRASNANPPGNWRLVNYDGRFWYWTPANQWMYYDGGNWQLFNGSYNMGAAATPYTARAPSGSR